MTGDLDSVSHTWCGASGCSAAIPALLAWRIPVEFVLIPATWLAVRSIAVVRGRAGLVAILIAGRALAYVAVETLQSWNSGQLATVSDAKRRILFAFVAGNSIVIPMLLSAAAVLVA